MDLHSNILDHTELFVFFGANVWAKAELLTQVDLQYEQYANAPRVLKPMEQTRTRYAK